MCVSFLSSSVFVLAALSAGAEAQPPYPGLLSEMRAADLIVLVKAEKTKPLSNRAPPTQTIVRNKLSGRIIEVYKGEAKKGQAIEIDVPTSKQSLRMQGQLRVVGHLFFLTGPLPGRSTVFLLKGKPHQVINITREHPIVPEYARVSQLETDAETALELARLYAQLSLVEKTQVPRVLDDDLKRYYKHLDENGEAFAKMVGSFREVVLQAVKKFDVRLLPAAWLGSYLAEADRKELVGLLLDHYAENARKLEEARKALPRAKVAPPPNEGAGPGGGAPAPDPVTLCLIKAKLSVCSMNLLMDSSWHAQVSGVPQGRGIIPWDLLKGGALFTEKTLTKANKFVEK